jgi:hypothetical protein
MENNGDFKIRFQDIYTQLENPPTDRTVRQDLQLLRELGLVQGSGRGPAHDGGSSHLDDQRRDKEEE